MRQLKLFVNYRRADERIFVELLRTHFMHRYGRENVFMDFDSIPLFEEFEDFIRQMVRECDVIAVMIGNRWLDLLREKEAKGEPDYVRLELEEALRHNKVIAPICIQGATMPSPDDLPESLRPLCMLNAAFVSDGVNVLDNIPRIMDGFEGKLTRRGTQREIENPQSQQQIEGTLDSAGVVDCDVVLKQYAEALQADNLPLALMLLSQLNTVKDQVPTSFGLDQREAALQERLKAEEDSRRCREVADFQFKFVRSMVNLNDSPEHIISAVRDIWQVDEGYIPDDLISTVGELMRPIRLQEAIERARTFSGKRNHDWIPFITTFKDLEIPDMAFCLVPMGSFQMGADDITEDDRPIHIQTIRQPYYIAQFPVTNAQWALGVKAGVVKEPEGDDPRKWYRNRLMSDAPVVGVSWFAAKSFAEWLGCRLPTEVEWEYAARGVESLVYPWGNEWKPDCCVWYENSGGKPASVLSKKRGTSWIGAHHLSGNVWEWTNSVFRSYPYKDVDDRKNDNSSYAMTAHRGGSWNYDVLSYFRAACRNKDYPNGRSNVIGFRMARSIE